MHACTYANIYVRLYVCMRLGAMRVYRLATSYLKQA